MAVIRMSQLYDLDSDTILYAGMYLPTQLFQSDDALEQRFIRDIFMLVRELASCFLTDTEIALYSSSALMSPGNGSGLYLDGEQPFSFNTLVKPEVTNYSNFRGIHD